MARNTPPPPPRETGDPDTDRKAVLGWFIDYYKVAVLEDLEDTGSFTISESNTSAEITGFVAQSNNAYRVTATAESYVGSPPDGAFIIKSVVKETGKFTVTLAAAPGSGNSVTFNWHIKR